MAPGVIEAAASRHTAWPPLALSISARSSSWAASSSSSAPMTTACLRLHQQRYSRSYILRLLVRGRGYLYTLSNHDIEETRPLLRGHA